MGRNLAEERIGMTFISNQGCKFFVVQYVNSKNVIVKFCDEYGAEVHTQWNCCKKGEVRNPYFKSVYGIGMLGEGYPPTGVRGKMTKEYVMWKHMLDRCYSGNFPTYENVTVCDRWLVYANFLEDLPFIEGYELWLNGNEMICLDKDLKQQGVENKVYSLETCKFVTKSENSKEAMERKWNKH